MYSHSKSSLGIKLDALIRVREPDIGKSDAHVVLRRFFKKEYTDLEFVRTVGTGGPVKFFLTV